MKKTLHLFLIAAIMALSIPTLSAQFPKIKKPKIKKPKVPDALKKDKGTDQTKVKEIENITKPEVVQNLEFGDVAYLDKLLAKGIWDARTYNYVEKLKASYDYVDKWDADGKSGKKQALDFLAPYEAKMHENPRPNIHIAAGFINLKNIDDLCDQEMLLAVRDIEKGLEANWSTFDERIEKYPLEIDEIEKELSNRLAEYRLSDFLDTAKVMVAEAREKVVYYQQQKVKVDAGIAEVKAEIDAKNLAKLQSLYEAQPQDEQNHPDKIGQIIFSKTEDISTTVSSSFKINETIFATSFLNESFSNTLRAMYREAPNKENYEFLEHDEFSVGGAHGKAEMDYRVTAFYARPIYKIYLNGKNVGTATGTSRNYLEKRDGGNFDNYLTGVEIQEMLCEEGAHFSNRVDFESNNNFKSLEDALLSRIHRAVFAAGAGNHTVKVELHVSPTSIEQKIESKLLAQGSFQYNISPSEFKAFKDKNIAQIRGKGRLHSEAKVAEVKRLYGQSGFPGTIKKVHITSNSMTQEFIGDNSLLERKWYDAQIIVEINGRCGLFKVRIKAVEKEVHQFGPFKLYANAINEKSLNYYDVMTNCN